MQRNEIKAFRQRLVRAGFYDISIYETYKGFNLYCYSPDGVKINKDMSIEEIRNTPHLVWFD